MPRELMLMSRFGELLRAANNFKLLAAIGRSGGELSSVADLLDNMIDSPQMLDSVRRFRAVPGGAAMLEGRYPPLQPDIDRLIQLPEGSLGRVYAELIRRLNYDPEFFRPRPTSSEAQWLTQRVATTHDIHHVVAGFGTMPAGESGVLAITAAQLGFPAYVLLTTAAQLASFRFQTDRFEELSWRPAGRRVGSAPSASGASSSASATPPMAAPTAWCDGHLQTQVVPNGHS